MMQNSNILIIDHNVLRFHSFDLFRYLLMEHERFLSLKNAYREFLKMETVEDQLTYYIKHMDYLDPLMFFDDPKTYKFPDSYLGELKRLLTSKMERTTYTDLRERIGIIFDRRDITGEILHFTDERNVIQDGRIQVIKNHNLLNANWLADHIVAGGFNAVMVDSIDMAVTLAMKISTPTTFIVANYRYNYIYNEKMEMLIPKGLRFQNILEYKYKHEFGTFDPFTGLIYKRNLEKRLQENDN